MRVSQHQRSLLVIIVRASTYSLFNLGCLAKCSVQSSTIELIHANIRSSYSERVDCADPCPDSPNVGIIFGTGICSTRGIGTVLGSVLADSNALGYDDRDLECSERFG